MGQFPSRRIERGEGKKRNMVFDPSIAIPLLSDNNSIEINKVPDVQPCRSSLCSVPSGANPNEGRKLPIDILLEIAEHLEPVTLRCLSYTCHSLRQRLRAAESEAMGRPLERTHMKLHDFHAKGRFSKVIDGRAPEVFRPPRWNKDWLDLLFILDRDAFWPGKAACSACVAVHDKASFHPKSLNTNNISRQCLGSLGCVWVCPHKWYSYLELEAICNSPLSYQKLLREKTYSNQSSTEQVDPVVPEGVWTKEENNFCFQCSIPVTITSWGKSQLCYPLAVAVERVRSGRLLSLGDFAKHMGDFAKHMEILDAPICPHLKLSSPSIMRAYCPNRWARDIREDIACHCEACSVSHQVCPNCQAKFYFSEGLSPHWSIWICLVVERNFDPAVGITDPRWISQTVPQLPDVEPGKLWPFAGVLYRARRKRGLLNSRRHIANITALNTGIFYFWDECKPAEGEC